MSRSLRYANSYEYATGGGVDGDARARWELVRLAAAAEMVIGADPRQVARELHVTRKSAYAWHKQAAEANVRKSLR